MSGTKPRLSPLQLRKELLIAESEINRVRLREEWRAMTDEVRGLADRVKSVSSLASAAVLLVSGVVAFQRGKFVPTNAKPSWLQTALKGAQVAGSLWLALRARQNRARGN